MGKVKGGTNGSLSRKELRKAHRQAAKEKKQQRHNLKQNSTGAAPSEAVAASASSSERKRGNGKGDRKLKDGGAKQGSGSGGGGTSGTRRKRWRPEELDPMIAAEDAELKRLERLLGVSGPNAKKKRAKLEREIEVEDGMGDEFGAFLSDLDRIGDGLEGGAGGSGSSDDDRALMEANWDFHENVPEDDNSSVIESTAGKAGTAAAQEEEEEEEDDDLELGGGGMELLDGVVDSDEDMLETIEEEEDEEEEEGGEEEENGQGGQEEEDRKGNNEWQEEEEEEEEEGEEENEDDLAERQQDQEGLDSLYSREDTAGFGDEDDEDVTPGMGEGKTPPAAAEDSGDDEEESEDFKRHTYKPKPGQDIYGRTIGAAKGGTAPAAYVPPHLRAAATAAAANGSGGVLDKSGASAKRAEVQRVVNGIMNRLSEETLEPVTARLREAYRGHSTTEANEALWQATRAVCVHDKHVMLTLIPSFTAVIAALNISLGADVGGFFLETIARELKDEVWGGTEERSDAKANGVKSGIGGARGRGRGTGSNLLLLLAYLYNYGVAHCTLVYDIIGLLVDGFTADEMELLLLLLRHSGYQLRSDDPQALKQIVALVKEKSATAAATGPVGHDHDGSAIENTNGHNDSSITDETNRWKAAFGAHTASSQNDGHGTALAGTNTAVGGSRARYILDTILELQSNKRSRIQEQGQESGRRVRKWLGSVKAAKGGGAGGAGGGDASLRVSWAELVSTESKGRWWRVGAAWAGRERSSAAAAAAPGEKVDGAGSGAVAESGSGSSRSRGGGDASGEKESEAVGLLALAARQRMNTDVRRSVFVAIVGSTDCEDALEKILRLNLKGAQEREIARVIMECCSQEVSYNPYYAHLAERVCDRQPKLRFTFQVAFWDALKTLDDGAARRAGSLARLMAHLVIRKQLSLTVLKTVEVPDLSPSGLLLMRVFFHEIIAAGDDAALMELFRRLARPPGAKEGGGHSAARDNALVFLRGHLGPAPSSWDRDRRKAFRKRVKGACRLIEAIVTADELG